MEDKKIIELFFERSENAIAAIKQKYSGLYMNILRQLLTDNSDIEECENDILLAVWNSIPPNTPEYLHAYICKIARRIGINKYKHTTRLKRNLYYTVTLSELEDCIACDINTETQLEIDDKEKLQKLLNDFVEKLDPKTRVLFIRHYVYMESIKDLSKRFDISENLISVKLFRARKKLKTKLLKEGIGI